MWIGLVATVAAIAVLVFAFVRADDIEEARREGWVRRGQGRDEDNEG